MKRLIYKKLTEKQRMFIDRNKEEKTVPEMAEHLETSKGRIWHYSREKRNKGVQAIGYFNVNEHENWIA